MDDTLKTRYIKNIKMFRRKTFSDALNKHEQTHALLSRHDNLALLL